MDFPKERKITARKLAEIIKDSMGDESFCFVLGAGASVESGISTGGELEMEWMNYIEDNEERLKDYRKTADDLRAKNQLKYPFSEIEAAWNTAKKNGWKTLPSKYYFDLYKLRFYPHRKNGYRFLEDLMERAEPSMGYHVLAKLLTWENCSSNLVITTNFDSLVEDSLFLYTDKKPLVAGHESLAGYMESKSQRPVVAKVHRGLMYEPFNSTEDISKLQPQWSAALSLAFKNYTPIVIGYAGGDQSLMAFMNKKSTEMHNGIYWCYLEKYGLPDETILNFLQKKNGVLVAIDGFDALMLTIGSTLFPNDISPDGTEKCLRERFERRVQNYNEKYAEAKKKQENKEAMQPIEAAQQTGEKKREEDNALTAWDYIRRGNRFSDKGDYPAAITEYENAMRVDPKLAAAYNNRGNRYDDLGKSREALADYNKAIELDSKYAFAYNNRGSTYHKLEQYDKALADYDKAIELDPKYATAYNNRGITYRKLKQYDKAIADYNKAIELDPKFAITYYNRGNSYFDLKQYDKALADYNIAIELDSKYAAAYYNRGNAYDALGEYDKALADFNKAIELNPKYVRAYNNRAKAYRAIGEIALAEADEEMAKKLK